MKKEAKHQIIIFGASGDLAKRKLFPALHTLYTHGSLANTNIIGYGRKEFDIKTFHTQSMSYVPIVTQGFQDIVSYVNGSYTDFSTLKDSLYKIDTNVVDINRIFYLSLPPSIYEQVLRALPEVYTETGWNRIVMEKPFGYDITSALQLQQHVLQCVPSEDSLFLMDHYLAKGAVECMRDMLSSRDDRKPVRIQIRLHERIGVDDRDYFDQSGIIRDVVQNHLLQIAALICTPYNKLHALQEIISMKQESTTYGQYEGYPFKNSSTPTYVSTVCYWRGIPIYIEAGKAMHESFVEIDIEYAENDIIHVNVQPDGVIYHNGVQLMRANSINAYVTIFDDVIKGDHMRFTNFAEVHESWRIVNDILDINSYVPLHKY